MIVSYITPFAASFSYHVYVCIHIATAANHSLLKIQLPSLCWPLDSSHIAEIFISDDAYCLNVDTCSAVIFVPCSILADWCVISDVMNVYIVSKTTNGPHSSAPNPRSSSHNSALTQAFSYSLIQCFQASILGASYITLSPSPTTFLAVIGMLCSGVPKTYHIS